MKDNQINSKLYSSKTFKEILDFKVKPTLETGIEKIDKLFSFPSGYYVVLGNPGAGKSWLALWLSRVFYRHNQKQSVYFSLEMPQSVVTMRLLQQWSDLTKAEFERGKSTKEALELLAKDVFVTDCFYEEDTSQQTPQNFSKWIDIYYKHGFRVFHFDHLHELLGANDNKLNQTVTENWAKCFQQICKNYDDIWLFVYAQPNGAAANKKILRRTDIAGSKAITQKCDYFLSINRSFEIDDDTGLIEVSNEDKVILFLDKTRYTEKTHIGFKLLFDDTANYYSYTEE